LSVANRRLVKKMRKKEIKTDACQEDDGLNWEEPRPVEDSMVKTNDHTDLVSQEELNSRESWETDTHFTIGEEQKKTLVKIDEEIPMNSILGLLDDLNYKTSNLTVVEDENIVVDNRDEIRFKVEKSDKDRLYRVKDRRNQLGTAHQESRIQEHLNDERRTVEMDDLPEPRKAFEGEEPPVAWEIEKHKNSLKFTPVHGDDDEKKTYYTPMKAVWKQYFRDERAPLSYRDDKENEFKHECQMHPTPCSDDLIRIIDKYFPKKQIIKVASDRNDIERAIIREKIPN